MVPIRKSDGLRPARSRRPEQSAEVRTFVSKVSQTGLAEPAAHRKMVVAFQPAKLGTAGGLERRR